MPLFYSIFRYFCCKNRYLAISIILSTFLILFLKKNDPNCILSDIADKFLYWSETSLLPCTPLLSH